MLHVTVQRIKSRFIWRINMWISLWWWRINMLICAHHESVDISQYFLPQDLTYLCWHVIVLRIMLCINLAPKDVKILEGWRWELVPNSWNQHLYTTQHIQINRFLVLVLCFSCTCTLWVAFQNITPWLILFSQG